MWLRHFAFLWQGQEFLFLHILTNMCCQSSLYALVSHDAVSVFVWVSLITNDVQHLSMYLLEIYVSSLEKHLFKSTPIWNIAFLFLLSLSSHISCIQIIYQMYNLCISSPICDFFLFYAYYFLKNKSKYFNISEVWSIFFYESWFKWYIYKTFA